MNRINEYANTTSIIFKPSYLKIVLEVELLSTWAASLGNQNLS